MRRCYAVSAAGQNRRSGLTLLEILISTAIFLGALTAILQLMNLGHDSRLSARLDAEAALHCESIMAEIIAGIRQPTDDTGTIDGYDNWQYTITTEDGGGDSLLKVTVLVEHAVSEDQANAYFRLTRLLRDPQLFLDAALSAAEASP